MRTQGETFNPSTFKPQEYKDPSIPIPDPRKPPKTASLPPQTIEAPDELMTTHDSGADMLEDPYSEAKYLGAPTKDPAGTLTIPEV